VVVLPEVSVAVDLREMDVPAGVGKMAWAATA
jgi:hypothetical protein